MTESSKRTIAVFDFDGTITKRDTLAPFLAKFAGKTRVVIAGLRHAPSMLAAAIGFGDRDAAKEKFLITLIGGRLEGELISDGLDYAALVLSEKQFNTLVIERLTWHIDEGHEVVVISASLDVYIQGIAASLGATQAFGTEIEVNGGVLTGRLLGGNVRAANKVQRLDKWLDGQDCEIWAYGDSSGDDQLLERATRPHRVKNGEIQAVTY